MKKEAKEVKEEVEEFVCVRCLFFSFFFSFLLILINEKKNIIAFFYNLKKSYDIFFLSNIKRSIFPVNIFFFQIK